MKNKKIIVLISIGLIFLVIFFSPFSFSRTTSTINAWSAVEGSKLKTEIVVDKPYMLVFHGLDNTILPDINNDEHRIDVYVEKHTSFGMLRFLPVYKPISFESKIVYHWKHPMIEKSSQSQELETGDITINGNYNLLGSFSTEKAEHLIDELICKSIKSKIQTDIDKRLAPEHK